MSEAVEKRYRGVYLGVPLPEPYRNDYEKVLHEAGKINPSLVLTHPRKPHSTLIMVGSLGEEQLPTLEQIAQKEAAAMQPYELHVGGPGVFESRRTGLPEVLFLDVDHPPELIAHHYNLRERLRQMLECPLKWFNPHLHMTVGFIRDPKPDQEAFANTRADLEDLLRTISWQFSVEELVIFGRDVKGKAYDSIRLASFAV